MRWLTAIVLVCIASGAPVADAIAQPPPEFIQGVPPPSPPAPHLVWSRSAPLAQARTALAEFETAPFPYNGARPGAHKPFFDVIENGRRGHRTARGRVFWEMETYGDRRVLLHIPKGFDARRPCLMLVFFHGHGATLARDVNARQRLPDQISSSGLNAVLVAPQFAVAAPDSNAGRFWEPGAFGEFLGEAAQHLARLHGDQRTVRTFASMPIVIVAYSGGYLPTAWSLTRGGLMKRVRGVVLFDALYGRLGTFANWIAGDRSAIFVSSYTHSTRARNEELQRLLTERGVPFSTVLEPRLRPGTVTFLEAGPEASHRDFLTQAWAESPIEDLLRRIGGFRR